MLFNADKSDTFFIFLICCFKICYLVLNLKNEEIKNEKRNLTKGSEFKKRDNKMKKGPLLVQEKNPKLCLGLELLHTLFVL